MSMLHLYGLMLGSRPHLHLWSPVTKRQALHHDEVHDHHNINKFSFTSVYELSIYFSFVVFLFLVPEVGIHSVLSHMDLCNFSRGKEMMKCDKFLKNPSIPLKDAIHVSLELVEAHLKGVYILWRLYFGTNQES